MQKFNFTRLIPDYIFYNFAYFRKYRTLPNFKNPKKFSEKIFLRRWHPHPEFTILADKYAMRAYVTEKVGAHYLPVNYLCTKALTQAQFDALPERFVMKANHSSGDVRLITDKSKESYQELAKLGAAWLEHDFSSAKREKHYRDIPRRLVFEELLGDGKKAPADFHIFTFRDDAGKVHNFIRVISGRETKIVKSLHLADWSLAPFEIAKPALPAELPPRPDNLDHALELAERLLGQHNFMRVDFYMIDDKLYVGELTLTPASGKYTFSDPQADLDWGRLFGGPSGRDEAA